jgi:hypothetical protein
MFFLVSSSGNPTNRNARSLLLDYDWSVTRTEVSSYKIERELSNTLNNLKYVNYCINWSIDHVPYYVLNSTVPVPVPIWVSLL